MIFVSVFVGGFVPLFVLFARSARINFLSWKVRVSWHVWLFTPSLSRISATTPDRVTLKRLAPTYVGFGVALQLIVCEI